jgi:ribosome biogenesis protein YTM1
LADHFRHILLSSYLSHLKVLPLSAAQNPLYTLNLPTSLGATSCAWISPASQTSDILLAAGGVDRQIHVFSLPSLDPDIAASENNTAKEVYTLHGHTGPISSIIGSRSGNEVISASWDGNINFYSLPPTYPDEHQVSADPTSYLPGQKKRRRVDKGEDKAIEGLTDGDATGEGGWRRLPDGVMRGHKGRVGGVVWDKSEDGRVWSAGWDGSVRGWEVESGAGAIVRVSLIFS